MSPQLSYEWRTCPLCRAENDAASTQCWRCRRSLPTCFPGCSQCASGAPVGPVNGRGTRIVDGFPPGERDAAGLARRRLIWLARDVAPRE